MVINLSIKKLRKSLDLTQEQAAKLVHMPLRTYIYYENDPGKESSIKYLYIKERLEEYGFIDEEHEILSLTQIQDIVLKVFPKYEIEYCYLFGSYAKSLANESSDIYLLISTTITGLAFYGIIEELRNTLRKRVEAITLSSLHDNPQLIDEILKDGIKIYSQKKG